MTIIKIVVFSLLGAFLSLILKEYKPSLALALSVITAITVLFFSLPWIERVIDSAKGIYYAVGGKDLYVENVLKVTGIACVTWIGSDVLKEAGLLAAASAVTIAGKAFCVFLCIPVLGTLFETLTSLLPM